MRVRDLSCPVCQADIPLSGDEKKGDEVFCTFCGSPCKFSKGSSDDEEALAREEDF